MSSFKIRKEKNCLNCGHEVEKHFCPECGQENIELKEDALHMIVHTVADYFHFEHKFFQTIKPLLLKPGWLTKEYVSGKRVSFIHPIKLYIFISIVFFIFTIGKGIKVNNTGGSKGNTNREKLISRQLNGIEQGLKWTPLDKKEKDSILREARLKIEKELDKPGSKWDQTEKINYGSFIKDTDTTVEAYNKRQLSLAKDKRDGFFKHYIKARMIKLNEYPNPTEKFVEYFIHNIPKAMFLLLPLFALILKLVYINKKKYFFEHLIYSFHLHSAIFLAILIGSCLNWMLGLVVNAKSWIYFISLIYILWYIYRSLRTFYNSNRWITLLKIFFLFFCYNMVAVFCILVLLASSIMLV
ncbi:MAG: DUF3667 domain-containing protein [Pedobacter sp.]|nr:MAG: DUF3667 domain-containing protein [Pedobacter sp.]